MYFGACYYPEHWPESRWATDARLMKEAGLNVVRIGEFAWSKFERYEGQYDFDWLDRSIAILAEAGICVVLGTPTATPPKWLMDKHPDIYMKDKQGHVRGYGNRRHYCYNNPNYPRYVRNIVTRMAERYGNNTNVIAWQTDNEFGCNETTRCYCNDCAKAFRVWLADKYEHIDRLNDSWGTVFWSHIYNDWEQIELPAYTVFPLHNPGMELDFRRFASDSVVAFQQAQIDLLRELAPNQPITHNLMGAFDEIDGFDLSAPLDFASWDNYPNLTFADQVNPADVAMQHDMTRGLKNKNFWVLEHQSGSPGGNFLFPMPKPGEIRRWTYQSVAHGADAIVYFRWRTCLFGAEQFWHGILQHDGLPGRRYEEVKRTGEELQRISSLIEGSSSGAEVAMIRCYDNEWTMEVQEQAFGHRYMAHFKRYYRYFYERGIPVDIVSDRVDLTSYKLVVIPHLLLSRPGFAERLYAYAAQGGTVVLDFRSGTKRWDNQMESEPLPGAYKELLGIRVNEYGSLMNGKTYGVALADPAAEASDAQASPATASTAANASAYLAQTWFDVIELEGAEAIATYAEDYVAGMPAATRHAYKQGTAYYLGMEPQPALMSALMNRICDTANVHPIAGVRSATPGVELMSRLQVNDTFLFAINHSETTGLLHLDEPMHELIENRQHAEGEHELPPNGVRIFRYTQPKNTTR
ncbi:beta-galactosidase [Cohnella yongneupensis]|uniref:Beta-galactosidase n=1 Tax=Cohnella yongneupensis TaxID=425006 RepID=A0ABW0R3A3_9BACL